MIPNEKTLVLILTSIFDSVVLNNDHVAWYAYNPS